MDQKQFARMGGNARAKKMTKKQRSESARRAATARWAAKNKPSTAKRRYN
jgi:hypothetical protein